MATVLTSKRGTSSAAMTISSLAVWKTSSTADRPKSKTPSRTRTSTRMATTISNMAFLPLAIERFALYALRVSLHQPKGDLDAHPQSVCPPGSQAWQRRRPGRILDARPAARQSRVDDASLVRVADWSDDVCHLRRVSG